MTQLLQNLANIATILAFVWAIYEFILKRKTVLVVHGSIAPLFEKGSLVMNIEIYNSSADKLVSIRSLCVETKGWKSYSVCDEIEQITLEPYDYKKVAYDIVHLLESISGKIKGKHISFYLETTSGERIEVVLEDIYKELLFNFIRNLRQKRNLKK